MEEQIIIKLRPNDSDVCIETVHNGFVKTKNIGLETLKKLFIDSLSFGETKTGILPSGCIHMTVNDDYRELVLCHGQLYADITYYNEVFLHFPLPRLVFSFKVNNEGRIMSARLGVIKDEQPKPDTPMYLYPFSNMSTASTICLGSNSLPQIKELRTMWSLPDFILRLPNNSDSYMQSSNQLELEYRELLEHLRYKEPGYYYEKVLVPSGHTLQDFIDRRF